VLRPKFSREFIANFLKDAIPEYEEMLVFIEKNGGWISLPPKVLELIDRLKIHNYPELYRSQDTLNKMLLLAIMSVDEINSMAAELEKVPEKDRAACAEEFVQLLGKTAEEVLDNFPDTPEKEREAQKAFDDLNAEEKIKAVQQAQITMSAFYATFFNTISIMVHGRKLTDLVQTAERGIDEAFFLAVQVDKRILSVLPYFKERHENAISTGDIDFLDKLHYRLTSPLLRSKIRYKTLWLSFALLDESGLLDGSLKHREILDICEDAGVGGHKNRIEDVGYLSKRIREYRLFQKSH
jgi:hypothetical protein